LAFWLNGGFLEHYEHAIDGTPCQAVIETKSSAHFPERLLEFFPTEPDLAARLPVTGSEIFGREEDITFLDRA